MEQTDLLDFDYYKVPLAKTSDDYYTPKWIFDQLGLQFDIDVASPVGGIPWIPAKTYFTQYDDGLTQDWSGKRVWMNPPYSKPAPWINKWLANRNGVALLPMSKSKWFEVLWAEADALLAMPCNLKFSTGEANNASISVPVLLAAMGVENVNALKASGLGLVR